MNKLINKNKNFYLGFLLYLHLSTRDQEIGNGCRSWGFNEQGYRNSTAKFNKSNTKLKQSVDIVNLSFSKFFSTSTGEDSISKILQRLDSSFIEWFVGFSDAEGSFDFIRKKNRNTYVFRFRISLHLDDMAVLNYIKDNLGLGRVSLSFFPPRTPQLVGEYVL